MNATTEMLGNIVIDHHFPIYFVLFEQELISILPITVNIRLITIDIKVISYVIILISYVIKVETSILRLNA